ncbi:apurinic endonuclease Apn1 [Rhodopirellula maiorica SM1]|uniref:Probable endonuclease 4 n=1 Tax=Rhodopirellula maiorica SM1 TaxID=1265738 RepID=M5S3S5_9BACT|nr:deoxyribonuclease IV [Rhodopirellula maiorica]EMI20824.1 apurinic endonuclease Apn1 [Rhodopirellula maiorica SM1]
MAKNASSKNGSPHLFGSHVSVAGGLAKGVARAVDVGCDVIQVFTKNNNQWAAKPLVAADIDAWKTALANSGIRNPIAHASYLINLASPKDDLFQKSVDSLVMELERANELEIEGLVVHPGAFTTSSEADGIKRIIDAVVEVLGRVTPGSCRLLLENTAGQGSCLGHQIHQLAAMIEGGGDCERVGVCLDTCHAFAAGYEINTKQGFADFRQELDDLLPAGAIAALHLNDSKKPLGSRVDRHEHIGRGEIGLDGFRHVLTDDKLSVIPGYLETEKGTDEETGEDWDRINLATLRRLVAEIV